MAGRRPQPTGVVKLKGTGNTTRLQKRAETEPEVLPVLLPPPPQLSERARELWAEASHVLFEAKVISRGDYLTLYAYCESYSRWREALECMDTEGMVFLDQNGCPKVSPYHKIAMDCQDRMMRCAVELGLTPASRTKVAKLEPKDITPENDEWDV